MSDDRGNDWDGAPVAKGKVPSGPASSMIPGSPTVPTSMIPDSDQWLEEATDLLTGQRNSSALLSSPPITPTASALPVGSSTGEQDQGEQGIQEVDEWGITVVPSANADMPLVSSSTIRQEGGVAHSPVSSKSVPSSLIPALEVIASQDEDSDINDWGVEVPVAHPKMDKEDAGAENVFWCGGILDSEGNPSNQPYQVTGASSDLLEVTSEHSKTVKASKGSKGSSGKGKSSGKKGKSKTKALGGIRMTPRDFQMLAFLARYRVATVGQLARRFQTSETALRNRLPALERAGLIAWAWAAQTKPKVWYITDQGLKTVSMNLTAPKVSWAQLRHTLGLTDLGIAFELAGEKVITEREIRAAATRDTPTARIKTAVSFLQPVTAYEDGTGVYAQAVKRGLVVPMAGRGLGHIPDMVLARQPYPNGMSGSIAVELELTRKGTAEWKKILSAYRDCGAFDHVYYYVIGSDVKRGLEGVINAIAASDKIHVERFAPVDLTADPGVTGGGGA